jgi:hypothetical protein
VKRLLNNSKESSRDYLRKKLSLDSHTLQPQKLKKEKHLQKLLQVEKKLLFILMNNLEMQLVKLHFQKFFLIVSFFIQLSLIS